MLVTIPALAVRKHYGNNGPPFGDAQAKSSFANRCAAPANSTSSVVREITGIIMMPRATLPESSEKCFCGTTTKAQAVMPITTEGTPFSSVRSKADGVAKFVAAIFGQKNSGANSQWNPIRLAEAQKQDGSDNRIAHAAALFTDGFGNLREKGPVQGTQAAMHDRSQNQEQRHSHDQGRHRDQAKGQTNWRACDAGKWCGEL